MIKGILIAAGTVAIIAAATFASWSALDIDLGGGSAAQEEPPPGVEGTGTVLRTSNRSILEVCVQFVDVPDNSPAATQAIGNVETAVAQVAADPALSRRGLVTSETNVDLGCPAPPAEGHDTTVETPSPYLFFVFIVPDEDLARYVGQYSAPYISQEFTCEGDSCVEVTAGLYFGHSEASNATRVSTVVRYALGLEELQSVVD